MGASVQPFPSGLRRAGWLLVAGIGCTPDAAPPEAVRTPGNVVVILADDVGTDKTGAYQPLGAPTYTPRIDELAARGVRFDRAYVSPSCSPTRASLLTGRHPTRTGVGRWLHGSTTDWDLPDDETTIPEMLSGAEPAWTSAAVGKWHVVAFSREDPAAAPLQQGFERHRGSLANPREAVSDIDEPRDFMLWEKNRDGVLEVSRTYMTTDTVDEAIEAAATLPEPWFLWLAFNAAHQPWHVPPEPLNDLGVNDDSPREDLYDSDVAAMDTEIGRFFDSLDRSVREDLTVVYLSDNGTPEEVIRPPYDPSRAKGTPFEGGVRVPFIVSAPWVEEEGAVSDAFVHAVDLLPTLAELSGVDPRTLRVPDGPFQGSAVAIDGISLVPLLRDPSDPGPRDTVFAEAFYPNGPDAWTWRQRTVRNETHKLIVVEQGADRLEQLHAFSSGPDEGPDLLSGTLGPDDEIALGELRDALDAEVDRLEFGFEG